MELTCKDGSIMIFGVRRGDQIGIVLQPTNQRHRVDSSAQQMDGSEYVAAEGDVVLFFNNLASARVLQDAVNVACLRLNRYEVKDLG